MLIVFRSRPILTEMSIIPDTFQHTGIYHLAFTSVTFVFSVYVSGNRQPTPDVNKRTRFRCDER